MKHVLNKLLASMMTEIYDQFKRDLKFDMVLPPTLQDNVPSGRYIPESRISQELRTKLQTILNGNDDNDNDNKDTVLFVNLYPKMTSIIIDEFRKLYLKYVDTHHAMFMINIAGRNRHALSNLLRPHSTSGAHSNGNGNSISGIDDRMTQYIEEMFTNKQIEINDKQIIKWVICKIMIPMESSVREISALLNDSFSRFKVSHNDLV